MARKGAKPPERGKPGPKTAPKSLDDPRILDTLTGLRNGNSLRASAAEAGVDHSTFAWWVIVDTPEGISKQYAHAREAGCDVLADGIDELAASALNEAMAAGPKLANAVVNAIRLRVDTLKWTLSKRQPGKYGEKLDVTSGGEKLPPQSIVIAGKEVTF